MKVGFLLWTVISVSRRNPGLPKDLAWFITTLKRDSATLKIRDIGGKIFWTGKS